MDRRARKTPELSRTSLKLGLLAACLPWRLDGALTAGGFTVRPGNGLELDFRAGCGEGGSVTCNTV